MSNVIAPMNINKNLISAFIKRCKKVIPPEYDILCINNYIYLISPQGDYMPTGFTAFHFIGMMEIHKDDPTLGKISSIVYKIISSAKHNFSIMNNHMDNLIKDITKLDDSHVKKLIFKGNTLYFDDGSKHVPLMNDAEFRDCYNIFNRTQLAQFFIRMYGTNISRFKLDDGVVTMM